jgi:hypothetical protein
MVPLCMLELGHPAIFPVTFDLVQTAGLNQTQAHMAPGG